LETAKVSDRDLASAPALAFALVVEWISRLASDQEFQVRVLTRAQAIAGASRVVYFSVQFYKDEGMIKIKTKNPAFAGFCLTNSFINLKNYFLK
jgi:hypothetical protein